MEGLYDNKVKQQSMEEFTEDKLKVLQTYGFYGREPTPDEMARVYAIEDLLKEYREKIERGILVK